MSGLRVFVRRNRIAVSFWIGAVLVLAGIGLSVYVVSTINLHMEKLFSPFSSLTQDEINQWQGSLDWWRVAKVTMYDPASIILIAAGLIAIIFSFISAIQYRSTYTSPPYVEVNA